MQIVKSLISAVKDVKEERDQYRNRTHFSLLRSYGFSTAQAIKYLLVLAYNEVKYRNNILRSEIENTKKVIVVVIPGIFTTTHSLEPLLQNIEVKDNACIIEFPQRNIPSREEEVHTFINQIINTNATQIIILLGYSLGGGQVARHNNNNIYKIIFSASVNPYHSFVRIIIDFFRCKWDATQADYPTFTEPIADKLLWISEGFSLLGAAGSPSQYYWITKIDDVLTHFGILHPLVQQKILEQVDKIAKVNQNRYN